jgi:LPPG:FO 2-phospho-L-lactate transferase
VVVLAGGTGGAKLARGLLDVAGGDLVVIANTGDDIEIYDTHVSPDPDLVAYWLADRIDERGWGIAGDTFAAMGERRAAGEDIWFNLGDEDLAVCATRAQRLAEGARLTDAIGDLTTSLGIAARVLPMTDAPVRTQVRRGNEWLSLQEWLIRQHGSAPVEAIWFEGATDARATPEVLEAIASARAIIIGPSNPVISIGPILALPGLRRALVSAPAPVIAVSPIVHGAVLKGPTAACLEVVGQEATNDGVASYYARLLDGIVADIDVPWLPTLITDVMLSTPDERRRVAELTLGFAAALS